MRILIVYHNACADGSFAAATVSLAFPLDIVHYIAADYVQPNTNDVCLADGTPLHEIPGIETYDKIYFVDFSVSESQLAKLTKHFGNDLYVFDHHDARTLPEYNKQCELLEVHPSTNVTFASKSSGVMLSYFGVLSSFDTSSARVQSMIGNLMRIVQLVSDRDTWTRDNQRAFAFYEGYCKEMFKDKEETGVLYHVPTSTVLHARNIILNGDVESIIAKGFSLIAERNTLIEKLYSINGQIFEPNDIIPERHAVLSTSRAIGSEAAQWVQDNKDVSLVLVVRCAPNNEEPEKVFCSVRSAGSKITARDVAVSFGGYGHPDAAGCVIPRDIFNKHYPAINPDYKQVSLG